MFHFSNNVNWREIELLCQQFLNSASIFPTRKKYEEKRDVNMTWETINQYFVIILLLQRLLQRHIVTITMTLEWKLSSYIQWTDKHLIVRFYSFLWIAFMKKLVKSCFRLFSLFLVKLKLKCKIFLCIIKSNFMGSVFTNCCDVCAFRLLHWVWDIARTNSFEV